MNRMAQQLLAERRQSFTPASAGLLRRKCDRCRKKRQLLQRRSLGRTESIALRSTVHEPKRSFCPTEDLATRDFLDPRFGHDFGKIWMKGEVLTGIQTKLAISQPDDIWEKEADQVAEKVMRMKEPDHSYQNRTNGMAIKFAQIDNPQLLTIQHQSEEQPYDRPSLFRNQVGPSQLEEKGFLWKSSREKAAVDVIPDMPAQFEIELDRMQSGGQPLSPSIRAFFEPRFGYNFSGVRVHTDSNAAESAQALSALAYTTDQNIVFGARQYAPQTGDGRRLLAHELAHVVQQANGVQASSCSNQPIQLSTNKQPKLIQLSLDDQSSVNSEGSDGVEEQTKWECYYQRTSGTYQNQVSGLPGDRDWRFIHDGKCQCEGKTQFECCEPGDSECENP
jgi:hypothetical protein